MRSEEQFVPAICGRNLPEYRPIQERGIGFGDRKRALIRKHRLCQSSHRLDPGPLKPPIQLDDGSTRQVACRPLGQIPTPLHPPLVFLMFGLFLGFFNGLAFDRQRGPLDRIGLGPSDIEKKFAPRAVLLPIDALGKSSLQIRSALRILPLSHSPVAFGIPIRISLFFDQLLGRISRLLCVPKLVFDPRDSGRSLRIGLTRPSVCHRICIVAIPSSGQKLELGTSDSTGLVKLLLVSHRVETHCPISLSQREGLGKGVFHRGDMLDVPLGGRLQLLEECNQSLAFGFEVSLLLLLFECLGSILRSAQPERSIELSLADLLLVLVIRTTAAIDPTSLGRIPVL